jgi:hypothetical protein
MSGQFDPKSFMNEPSSLREIAVGRTVAAFSVLVDNLMTSQNLRRSDLARRLETDKGQLTRQLSAAVDIRLSSVTEILWELGVPLYDVFAGLTNEVACNATVSDQEHVHCAKSDRGDVRLSPSDSFQLAA